MKHILALQNADAYHQGQLLYVPHSTGERKLYVSRILSPTSIPVRPYTWFWRTFFKLRSKFYL